MFVIVCKAKRLLKKLEVINGQIEITSKNIEHR